MFIITFSSEGWYPSHWWQHSIIAFFGTNGTWVLLFGKNSRNKKLLNSEYNRTTQAHYQQRRIRPSLLSQATPTHANKSSYYTKSMKAIYTCYQSCCYISQSRATATRGPLDHVSSMLLMQHSHNHVTLHTCQCTNIPTLSTPLRNLITTESSSIYLQIYKQAKRDEWAPSQHPIHVVNSIIFSLKTLCTYNHVLYHHFA